MTAIPVLAPAASADHEQLVGELSLLDGAPRSAGLVALSDCRLIQLPKGAFDLLRRDPAFEDELFHHIGRMLRRATEQLRVSYTYSSTERVAWCLARLAARSGPRIGDTIAISPKPSHQELADMVGCTRETVSRALLRLKTLRCLSWDADALHLNERAFRSYLEPDSTAGTADIARLV
jgi:CRP-like cAMP-binding protein